MQDFLKPMLKIATVSPLLSIGQIRSITSPKSRDGEYRLQMGGSVKSQSNELV